MKTILIEGVTNGWIVRPADFGVCRPADGNMAVYTDMEALKRDLPKLLEWDEPAPSYPPYAGLAGKCATMVAKGEL